MGMMPLTAVQEHLLYFGPDGKLLPGLAKSWSMSQDGLTVTFNLQKGVQFHDGWGEFTSADVKFSIELVMKDGAKSHYGPYFRSVISSMETPDPYTLVLKMKVPAFDIFTRMANQMAYFTVASKKYYESVGQAGANAKWIGTGSWKFVEYKKGDYVKFEAVENHWRQTPDFQYLIIKEVPDADTRVMMLRAGDLDATDVALKDVPGLEKAGFKVMTSTGFPFYIQLNGFFPPYDTSISPWVADPKDPVAWERARKVRQAMNYAVDKKALLDNIFYGKGKLTEVPFMYAEQLGYDPNWTKNPPYPYNPEKAKALLTEAGYPNGFTTEMRVFELAGRGELIPIGEAVSAMLEKVGIKIKLSKVDYTSTFRPMLDARTYRGINPYAYTMIEAPSMWDQNGTSKAARLWLVALPEFDKLVAACMSEVDMAKRAELTRKAAQYLIDQAVAIPISTKDTTFAVNPKKIGDWQLVPLLGYANQFEYIFKAK